MQTMTVQPNPGALNLLQMPPNIFIYQVQGSERCSIITENLFNDQR